MQYSTLKNLLEIFYFTLGAGGGGKLFYGYIFAIIDLLICSNPAWGVSPFTPPPFQLLYKPL